MPTKKKSKPLFEIPRAIQSAPQSGWVYRSSGGPESGAGYRAQADQSPLLPLADPQKVVAAALAQPLVVAAAQRINTEIGRAHV